MRVCVHLYDVLTGKLVVFITCVEYDQNFGSSLDIITSSVSFLTFSAESANVHRIPALKLSCSMFARSVTGICVCAERHC